jgi:hypothetical protein
VGLLEGQDLQLAIADVGDSEVLEDTGVGVSEVGVLNLEGGVVSSRGDQVPDFISNISRSVGGAKDNKLGGMRLEVLSLRDGDGSQNTIVRVDHMEELGDVGERVAKVGIGSSEVLVALVLLLGNGSHVLATIVSNENLDFTAHSVCDVVLENPEILGGADES